LMSVQKEKPYIGVAGVTLASTARIVAGTAREILTPSSKHQVAVGILTSAETSTGGNRGGRYPALEKISSLFEITEPYAFNTLHHYARNSQGLTDQIASILWQDNLYARKLCGGVQLNTVWPSHWEVGRLKEIFPELKIILQIGPRVLDKDSPQDIAQKVKEYGDWLSYALIDPSGGKGRGITVNSVATVYNAVKDAMPDLTLGFAGGLDPKNVASRSWELFQMTGSGVFSIDAETGLRVRSRRHRPSAELSPQRTRNFLVNAANFFRSLEEPVS
jgi:hypothetical protein